jgi:3-(3-hydroxy-phenyl)propionate hydroxylase
MLVTNHSFRAALLHVIVADVSGSPPPAGFAARELAAMSPLDSVGSNPKDNRVIIAGAGPVGLMLALKLIQNGVPVTLLESFTEAEFPHQMHRAGSNHPVTLQMYADVGIYQQLEARGLIAPTFQYWDRQRGEIIAEFDHAVIKDLTPYPYVLQCERLKVCEEALALASQHELCDLRLGHALVSFEQSADYVEAVAQVKDGGEERIRGRYIVSAEGARSVIRKSLGIDFEGFTYPDRTINITVAYDFTKHGFSHRNYISDPGEWMNLFHWSGPPEVWRVHFHTDPGADEKVLLDPDNCQALMQKFMPRDIPYDIVGARLFTIHQRVAQSFRRGRALLAGDAAHVNSPIGAMGMNSGVHDAMNLGEKLVRIWRGEGGEELLDLYERQRRTIAVDHVKAQTIRNKKLLTESDPAVRQKNHDQLRRTAEDPKLAREFLLRASMFDSLQHANSIT